MCEHFYFFYSCCCCDVTGVSVSPRHCPENRILHFLFALHHAMAMGQGLGQTSHWGQQLVQSLESLNNAPLIAPVELVS